VVVTKEKVCDFLKNLVKEKESWGKDEWKVGYCPTGCMCKPYKLPEKQSEAKLDNETVVRTEDVPILGKVRCVFTVSGTIKITQGALALVKCQKKEAKA
jgi:hypothetical protein